MKPTRKRLAIERLEHRQLLAAVSIPTDLSGQVAALVSAPVSIDNATGVRGATIRVTYDPNVLTLAQENVSIGSAWAGATDTQLTTNVNQATGTVVVFLSASTDLSASGGSLLQLGFVIRPGVAVGTISRIDLTEVRLNEGAIPVNPLPIAGVDSTDGSITVASGTPDVPGGLAQISGVVYADSNQDFSPSSFEGIPGVQLTLFNIISGSSQQTTTASDGSYQFTSLTPGSYRIVQTQPNALIDGGQNQLDVNLTANQQLNSQNFREIGLKPQFVSNRLLTTLVMPVGSDNWQSSISQILQLANATPVLNSLTTNLSDSNVESNSISNHVLELPTMNTLPASPGEGEGNKPAGNNVIAAQSAAYSLPQLTRRTKARGNSELVDEALASLPTFE